MNVPTEHHHAVTTTLQNGEKCSLSLNHFFLVPLLHGGLKALHNRHYHCFAIKASWQESHYFLNDGLLLSVDKVTHMPTLTGVNFPCCFFWFCFSVLMSSQLCLFCVSVFVYCWEMNRKKSRVFSSFMTRMSAAESERLKCKHRLIVKCVCLRVFSGESHRCDHSGAGQRLCGGWHHPWVTGSAGLHHHLLPPHPSYSALHSCKPSTPRPKNWNLSQSSSSLCHSVVGNNPGSQSLLDFQTFQTLGDLVRQTV